MMMPSLLLPEETDVDVLSNMTVLFCETFAA
jgi:hypothetical protein